MEQRQQQNKCHKRIKLELKHKQQKRNATNKCIKREMHPISIWNKKKGEIFITEEDINGF